MNEQIYVRMYGEETYTGQEDVEKRRQYTHTNTQIRIA